MNYQVRAFDKISKIWVPVRAIFLRDMKPISIQTNSGIFEAERFLLEIKEEEVWEAGLSASAIEK